MTVVCAALTPVVVTRQMRWYSTWKGLGVTLTGSSLARAAALTSALPPPPGLPWESGCAWSQGQALYPLGLPTYHSKGTTQQERCVVPGKRMLKPWGWILYVGPVLRGWSEELRLELGWILSESTVWHVLNVISEDWLQMSCHC